MVNGEWGLEELRTRNSPKNVISKFIKFNLFDDNVADFFNETPPILSECGLYSDQKIFAQ
jgi:hypothetical protein